MAEDIEKTQIELAAEAYGALNSFLPEIDRHIRDMEAMRLYEKGKADIVRGLGRLSSIEKTPSLPIKRQILIGGEALDFLASGITSIKSGIDQQSGIAAAQKGQWLKELDRIKDIAPMGPAESKACMDPEKTERIDLGSIAKNVLARIERLDRGKNTPSDGKPNNLLGFPGSGRKRTR